MIHRLLLRYLDAGTASLLAGGLSFSSGVGSDILNYFQNKQINAENIAFAREMNDLEYERYLQQWNRENAYNTPKSQMQRLVDAGLNPNLVYDSLSNANLGASPVPSATVPTSKPSQFDFDASAVAGTNQYLQGKLLEAQIKELDSKSDLNFSEAHRIAKLTEPEYDSMVANTNRIRQVMQSEDYRTKVELIKSQMLDDEDTTYWLENGLPDAAYWTFRELVMDNEFQRLACSQEEFRLMLRKLKEDIGLVSNQSKHVELQNKDLQEFVNVCAKIYNADVAQADVVVQSAELTKSYNESLGNAPKYVQLIIQLLDTLVNGVSKFTPHRPRSN